MSVNEYQLSVDWNNDDDPGDPGEDVTADARYTADVVLGWGRDASQAAGPLTAQTLDFTLINNLTAKPRRYSYENVNSDLYHLVLPGRRVTLQHLISPYVKLFEGQLSRFTSDDRFFNATATDTWGNPGAQTLSTAVYQGIRTGDAVNIVLDEIGWTGTRLIDPGVTVMPFWWEEGADASSAIEKIVDSEGPPAIAYVRGGTFVFEDRHHRTLSAKSQQAQGTFTHIGGVAGSCVTTTPPISLVDTYSRVVVSGWGSTPEGYAWTRSGGANSDHSVNGSVGLHNHSTTNTPRRDVLSQVTTDSVMATFTCPVIATGAPISAAVLMRALDPANTHYRAQVNFGLAGALSLSLVKRVAGVDSTLTSVSLDGVYVTGSGVTVAGQIDGSTLRAKAWLTTGMDPGVWQAVAVDDTIARGSPVGVYTYLNTGNTNTLPLVITTDNFTVTPADLRILKDTWQYDHGLFAIINTVNFSIDERGPGTTDTPSVDHPGQWQLWKGDASYTVVAGDTLTLTAQTDTPFINADVDFNLLGGTVTVTLSRTSGQSCDIVISASVDAIVTDLALVGTPITVLRTVQVQASDPSSIGQQAWQRTCPWANKYDAQAIANRIIATYAGPRPVISFEISNMDEFGCSTNVTGDYIAQIRERQVSDRIHVRRDIDGIDDDFIIEKIEHRITAWKQHHLRITCEVVPPSQPMNIFTFDVTGKGFDDGLFGVDGIDNADNIFLFDSDVSGHRFDEGVFGS